MHDESDGFFDGHRPSLPSVAAGTYARSAWPDASILGARVGTNKRYAESVDRQMDSRIAERIMRSGEPLCLTNAELQLDTLPLTRTPVPEPVRAWVRYPDGPIEVEALVVAWTPRAVAIKWPGPDVEHRAWVWASAVERLG